MSKVCDVCSKTRSSGNNVSHSLRRTKRTFLPNLQKVTINLGGVKKKLRVCSRCIRTAGKNSKV